MVYTFISFPDDYEDPLRSSDDYGAKERNRLFKLGYDGVREYIIFRKNFLVIGAKVLRKNDTKGQRLSAEDIDSVIATELLHFELEE